VITSRLLSTLFDRLVISGRFFLTDA